MSNKKRWSVYRYQEIHIIPEDDSSDHEMRITCPCLPKIEISDCNTVCTHNAFDGREVIERAEEIIEDK